MASKVGFAARHSFLFSGMALLSGCQSVSYLDYDAAIEENTQLRERIANVEIAYEQSQSQNSSLIDLNEVLQYQQQRMASEMELLAHQATDMSAGQFGGAFVVSPLFKLEIQLSPLDVDPEACVRQFMQNVALSLSDIGISADVFPQYNGRIELVMPKIDHFRRPSLHGWIAMRDRVVERDMPPVVVVCFSHITVQSSTYRDSYKVKDRFGDWAVVIHAAAKSAAEVVNGKVISPDPQGRFE